MLAVSYFDNLTIHLQATEYSFPFWCNQGIKLTNHGENPYNYNLIYMSRININANVNNNCLPPGGDSYHMGIRIDLEQTNYNTTLVLYDSTFHQIYIRPIIQIGLLHGVFSKSTLWIKNCTFQFNDHEYESDEPAIKVLISCSNMTLIFISCLFYGNTNIPPLLLIEEIDFGRASMNDKFDFVADKYCCRFPSYIHIRNFSFTNNTGNLMYIHGVKIV